MKNSHCVIVVLMLASTSLARAGSSDDIANQLGQALGSEQGCALDYDKNAIEHFISEHVDAGDMDFTNSLGLDTWTMEREIKQMSQSSLAAHCTQIRRVAKQNRFIK
jgi:hypothetical protein